MPQPDPGTHGRPRSGEHRLGRRHPAGSIQVASSPSEVEARAFLAKTNQQVPSVLADASGYTVPFDKDGVTYYRARFSGFELQDRRMERLQRAEKEENRLLRRPAVGGVPSGNLPEVY